MRGRSHRDKDCQNVEPEAEIGNPSVVSQGTNLSQEEADDDEYQGTDDVADAVLGHL